MAREMKGLFCSAEWAPRPGLILTDYEKNTGKTRRGNQIWKNCKLELRKDIPVVEPGPDDVVMKVRGCGVCGSDIEFVHLDDEGYMNFAGHCRMNIVLGHEFCGEVVEVGKNVKTLKVGDAIASETMGWCGVCDPCRAGYANQCVYLDEVGITQNGGMAEYSTVPAKWAYNMNSIRETFGDGDDVWVRGALVEPICVAFNSIVDKAGGIRLGTTAYVVGLGAIGLMSVGLLKAMGASKIIASDTKQWRLNAAKGMGADVLVNPMELEKQGISLHDFLMEETHGLGIDTVVEAAGLPHVTLPGLTTAMGIRGSIIQIGITPKNPSFNYTPLQMRAATLSFSIGSSGHNAYNEAIRLQASGLLDVMPAVGGTYSIDEWEKAFADARSAETGKIVFVYK